MSWEANLQDSLPLFIVITKDPRHGHVPQIINCCQPFGRDRQDIDSGICIGKPCLGLVQNAGFFTERDNESLQVAGGVFTALQLTYDVAGVSADVQGQRRKVVGLCFACFARHATHFFGWSLFFPLWESHTS